MQSIGIDEEELKIIQYKMNYLILIHNKYHSNEKRENNIINFEEDNYLDSPNCLMNIKNIKVSNNNNTNEKNKLYFENEKQINIGKYKDSNELNCISENVNKSKNNISFIQSCKNANFNNILNDIKKFYKESNLSFKKQSKRKYLDLLIDNEYKEEKIKNNNKEVINLNINNANYYYLNNSKYNINSEKKYGFDISKQKTFKKY